MLLWWRIIFTHRPNKKSYTFEGWELKHAIPEEYTELEYLESDGVHFQYIDMGYIISSNIKIYIEFESFSNGWLFGGSAGDSGGRWGVGIDGNNISWYSARESVANTYNLNGKNTALFDYANGFTLNGVYKAFDSVQSYGIAPRKLYLFFADGSQVVTVQRIYVTKIYYNDSIIHYLIPAKRNSDNIFGMYDTVTGTFFTNAGSGTFTAGPEIQ